MADRPRKVRPLGRRWHLRPPADRDPDAGGGGLAGRDRLHDRPSPPARGRQRGLELACDGRARPLAFLVTGGNRNDCTQAEAVIRLIRVPGPGPGRSRTLPDHVVADKGYSARTFRAYLRWRGIKTTMPERVAQLVARKRRHEQPCWFDKAAYQRRNVVERCFHRLK
ncbi:transposase [Streptomyces sp. NPDC007088]|uniref:transposase n=1 Tax=Streptomyces sp. NPDC007088 TaxID=3364773 RepID=UPI0036849F2F